ncbi:MAG TPA: RDD family protein [Candidatus Acidoferrum sp.]|nr:RDD family protein [Candidatus Acidoferrum sp.]
MDEEYKIIGGDGAEYGPASLDELKTWIGDGRVAGSTQVWRSDLAHWTPAARYAELQQALARLQASVSPATLNRALRAAGFWPRLAAYALDRIVLGMLFKMLCQWRHWEIPVLPQVINQETAQQFMDKAGQLLPCLLALFVLYDVLLNGTFGATLGKMAVGAKITCVDGSPLSYGRALLRSLAARFTEMTFCVGYLPVLVRPDKRGLHDLLAGTRVVLQR